MGSSGRGKALDVKLQIRYHGLKATQYFSKYTSESEDVFRHDLTTLKLPHPKKTNITFVSYGCVECIWPDVISGAVLHKNLTTKTSPPTPDLADALKKILEELSIVKLGLKEIYHGTRNKKRPQLHPDQDRTAPFPIKKRSHQELLTATTDLRFGQNYDSESSRPFKHPRIENPVYTNLPTIQSQSQRNHPYPYPSQEPTTHDRDNLPGPSTGSLSEHLTFLAVSNGFAHTRGSSVRGKQPAEVRQDRTETLHRLYDKPANVLHQEPSLMSGSVQFVNIFPNLVHNAQPNATTANQTKTGRHRSEGVFLSQKSPTKKSANTSFSSLPKETDTSLTAPGTMAGRLVSTEHSDQNATSVHPPLGSFPLPPALPVPAASNDDTPLRIKQEEVSSHLESLDTIDMARRRTLKSSRTLTSEHTAEIQRLIRESWDVKRQLTAAINREKVITSELKKLGSDWAPEPTLISDKSLEESRLKERLAQLEVERTLIRVQVNEDVKDRLAELEAQLSQERKLREEAENAIADIRRECRAPFVVPSLLDAFRQISELTTRAMEP